MSFHSVGKDIFFRTRPRSVEYVREKLLNYHVKNWVNDPNTLGAYANMKPFQVRNTQDMVRYILLEMGLNADYFYS